MYMNEKILNTLLSKVITIEEKLDTLATEDQLLQVKNDLHEEINQSVMKYTQSEHVVHVLQNKFSKIERRIAGLEEKQ